MTIRLAEAGGWYTLTVQDDGRGLPSGNGTGTGPATTGRGMLGMRERAELLGGRFEVDDARRRWPVHRGAHTVHPGHDAHRGTGDAMIRVLLADDQHLVRAGFRALLEAEDDVEIVGEAGTGREAVELATRTHPDVVLMDIRMPDGDGLWATGEIVADPALAGTRIVIVTTFELDEYVAQAIVAGASGFLVKDTEPVELIRAVRVVADGDALLSPGVTRRLIERVSGGLRPAPDSARTGAADGPREGGARARRARPHQLGDRRAALPQSAHRQDARLAHHEQAGCARPGASRRARVRDGLWSSRVGSSASLSRAPGKARSPGLLRKTGASNVLPDLDSNQEPAG